MNDIFDARLLKDALSGVILYFGVSFLFILGKQYTDPEFVENGEAMWAFSTALIPYCMGCTMLKGFNTRMMLCFMLVSLCIEHYAFNFSYNYVIENETSVLFRLNYFLFGHVPALLIIIFRVQIVMKASVYLYRYQTTRSIAIYLMKNNQVTRLDVYLMMTFLATFAVTYWFYVYTYAFYFGAGGEWQDFPELAAILIEHYAREVHTARYVIYDIISAFSFFAVIVTCFRERKAPDALSLKSESREANGRSLHEQILRR